MCDRLDSNVLPRLLEGRGQRLRDISLAGAHGPEAHRDVEHVPVKLVEASCADLVDRDQQRDQRNEHWTEIAPRDSDRQGSTSCRTAIETEPEVLPHSSVKGSTGGESVP
jgi:hypothetical protein